MAAAFAGFFFYPFKEVINGIEAASGQKGKCG
jgi:hypothetical protein